MSDSVLDDAISHLRAAVELLEGAVDDDDGNLWRQMNLKYAASNAAYALTTARRERDR